MTRRVIKLEIDPFSATTRLEAMPEIKITRERSIHNIMVTLKLT